MMQHKFEDISRHVSLQGLLKLDRIAKEAAQVARERESASKAAALIGGDSSWIIVQVAFGREAAVEKDMLDAGIEACVPMRMGPERKRNRKRIPPSLMPVFNRADKIRPRIRQWRGQYSDTPRAADTGMQVLSRILSHGVDPMGKLTSNPAEGIKHLYSSDRSEIIWTDADINQVKAGCSEEVKWVIDLAAHTGLRVGDLLRLSWSHVGLDAIVISTGKSKHKREAIIPRYDALNNILAAIPKRSPVVLTSTKKKPWKQDGFNTMFWRAKEKANMLDRDLHFHDLRGTAATKFYNAGLSIRVIAEIMAWEEETVEKIIRRYVGRQSATKEMLRLLNSAITNGRGQLS